MTNTTLFLLIVGAATVTSWLFRIVDAIEAPAGRRRRARATKAYPPGTDHPAQKQIFASAVI